MVNILLFLTKWIKRANFLITIGWHRMRAIETELGMEKNLIVHALDHYQELNVEDRKRVDELHRKHVPANEVKYFRGIVWVLISLWMFFMLGAWILSVVRPLVFG